MKTPKQRLDTNRIRTEARQTGLQSHRRSSCSALAVFALLGAGDPATRFNEIGHQMMCICGCNQILLECNHVGCPDFRRHAQRTHGRRLARRQRQPGRAKLRAKIRAHSSGRSHHERLRPRRLHHPFVALILGFGLIVLVIRAWKNRPAPAIADGLRPVRGAELEQFRDQARKETDL